MREAILAFPRGLECQGWRKTRDMTATTPEHRGPEPSAPKREQPTGPHDRPLDEVIPELYDAMHEQARSSIRRERSDHTLVPTALVNEVYMRLARAEDVQWNDRDHFLALSAGIMRRILVNHARDRRREKRGGGGEREPLHESHLAYEERAVDLLALDEALVHLARFDPLQVRIVELRFFGGFTMREIAKQVRQPLRTTERELALARAWLRRRLSAFDQKPDCREDVT